MIKKGTGLGLSFYGTGYGNGFPDVSKARVKLLEDGKIGIYVGATEVGQGAKTALAQIGVETLGVGMNDIEFIHEDTSMMPDSGTAAASRQTYNTGNAIKVACESFVDVIFELAKDELGLNSTKGFVVEDGRIYVEFFPQKNITYEELSKKYGNKLVVEDEFVAQTVEMNPETGQGAPYWPYTFNACSAEVEVNILTGQVKVKKVKFAQDVGTAVNPHLIEGQMEGGFAMALGYTLFEDLNLFDGKVINNKFSKYLIPTAMDMENIETIIVEDPEDTSPYGAKGIGEPVTIPVAPAILNAIYDATGVRVYNLPASPENLIKRFEEAKEETRDKEKSLI